MPKAHYSTTLYLIPQGRVGARLKYEPMYESIFSTVASGNKRRQASAKKKEIKRMLQNQQQLRI